MKALLPKALAFLLSPTGVVAKWVIAPALAWLGTFTSVHLGLEITPVQQAQAVFYIAGALLSITEFFINKHESKNKMIVQGELGIPKSEQDSYIGKVTMQAAKDAIVPEPPKKKRTAGLKHQNRP